MLKPVFDELGRRPPEAALHRRHLRRRHPPQPPDRRRLRAPAPGRRGTGHVLRPRFRRHRRCQQELGEDHRRAHRPVRAGLLRLRLEEVRLGHRVASPLRPGADSLHLPDRRRRLRRLPPVRPAREAQGARRTLVRVRRSCSTRPSAPTRCGTTCRSRCSAQIIDKHIDLLGHRRVRGRARGRDGQPHQHGDAAVLLPARRACSRPTWPSRRSRPRSRRPTPAAGRAVIERNFAAIDLALANLHRVEVPADATSDALDRGDRSRRRAELREAGHHGAASPATAISSR